MRGSLITLTLIWFQQSTFCWIRRCKWQHMIILLQQFTLVSHRRAQEIGCFPIPLRKGTDESKEKRSQRTHSVSSRTEHVCSYPTHTHRSCVSTLPKHFKLTLQKRTFPKEKKEDDVFHRCPFIPVVAHLFTS